MNTAAMVKLNGMMLPLERLGRLEVKLIILTRLLDALIALSESNARERDLALRLVLPLFVSVRGPARLVALEEEHLRDALVRVDLRRNRGRIRDLERCGPLP